MKNGMITKYIEEKNGTDIVQASVGNDSKLYGLLNIKTGEMVRDCEFSYMSDFVCGFAVIVDMDKRYGVIKPDGSFFIEPSEQYEYISIDEYGVIALKLDDRYELLFAKQESDTYPLKVRDFDTVFEEEDFSVLKVKIDSNSNNDNTGLITSKGFWITDPVYEEVTVFEVERMVLVEGSLGEGTLINLDDFKIILQEKNIRKVCYTVFCYSESDEPVFVVIEDGVIKQTIIGYKKYRVFSSSILFLFKDKQDVIRDVFNISEKDFILKDVECFSYLYDYKSEWIQDMYEFVINDRRGLVSNKGEIVLQAAIDDITTIECLPSFIMTVNGKKGIWNYDSKAWTLFPQFEDIIFDKFGCFKVSNIEAVGRFNRYRKVWRYVNVDGNLLFDEAFLEAGEIEENARAKVKTVNGKVMYITFS